MGQSGFSEAPEPYREKTPGPASVARTQLKIDSAGRVVIPAEMRAAMSAKPGDMVTAQVVDGEFRVISPDVALKRFQAIGREWRKRNPGVDLVQELVADRRAEARKEQDEANDWRRAHGLPPLE